MRQYIGARYVPKFFDNNGSTDWINGIPYETLTVVTYLGNSFTSKKPVPVGIDITNTDYWAPTGTYNSQIAELSRKVDELRELNMFLVMDSYGASYPDMTISVPEIMENYIPNLTPYIYSGDGFIANDGRGTFLQNFSTDTAGLTDDEKKAVDLILVAAGRNDYIATKAQILTAISAFVTYCKANFPNAVVKLAYVANGDNSSYGTRAQQLSVYQAYADCASVGACYINGAECIVKTPGAMASDNTHPSVAGKSLLAENLVEGVLNGSCHVTIDESDITYTYPAGVTGNLCAKGFNQKMIDNVLYLTKPSDVGAPFGSISFEYNNHQSVSTSVQRISLGNAPATSIIHWPNKRIVIDFGWVPYDKWTGSSTKSNLIADGFYCGIEFTPDGEINLIVFSGNSNITDLADIYIPDFNVSVPGEYC